MPKKRKTTKDLQHTMWFILFIHIVIAGGALSAIFAYFNEVVQIFIKR